MKKKFVIALVFEGIGNIKQLMPFTEKMFDTEQIAEKFIAHLLKDSKDNEVKVYCILPCYVKEI